MPKLTVSETIDFVLNDPAKFAIWWQRREYPHDRDIVAAAIRKGLVASGGGLLVLTAAGVSLQQAGKEKLSFIPENRHGAIFQIYSEGWQAANHAWQEWLDKYIPDWNAMEGFDPATLPKEPGNT